MFLRKSSLPLTLCVLIMGLLCPKTSRAITVTVFSDFGPGQSFNYGNGLGIYGPERSDAAPFTPAVSVTLTKIDVGVSCCGQEVNAMGNPVTATDLDVVLMSDAGGVPGAILEEWTISAASLPTAGSGPFAPITLNSDKPVTLVAGTTYWLAMDPDAFFAADFWNVSSTQSGNYAISNQFPFNFRPAFGPLPAFDVVGTVYFHWGFNGLGDGQTVHLVAGPVAVPPGVPVEATLGFVDINGIDLVPPMTVTLTAGQTAALDFNADTLIERLGQRIEVRPVVTPVTGTVGIAADLVPETPTFQGSLQIIDNFTKVATVLVPGKAAFFAAPSFVPQSLTAGQTLRVMLSAFPSNPCIAEVSFSDGKGDPLGFPTQVNLSPGQSTMVDLNADTLRLKFFEKIDVQTSVVLTSPAAALPGTARPPLASACPATVEVFDHRTGRTSTSQVSGTDE